MGRMTMFFGLALAQLAAGCADRPDSPLGAAAAADDVVEVRRLIAAGHGVDDVGPGGVTPLIAVVLELIERADSKTRTTPAK